ncbi:MAG: aldehyde dehydrogenase family protein, partial [Acidobacteriota bacterium]|nr:aldehyde dehydrogenase family protein [Acidobacteriota bacterium]
MHATSLIPPHVPNWIDGREQDTKEGQALPNLNPATGRELCTVARSTRADVEDAVEAARRAQPDWAGMTPVARGDLLREAALLMRERSDQFAEIVSLETGKSRQDARGETGAAVEMGLFVAGEGRRFYGKTTTSAVPHRTSLVVRQPLGVAGLIIAANTPIANVAWKAYPALLCGNAAVMKASEDTPATAWAAAKVFDEVGLPPGVFNVVQGYGPEAGAPLVEHPDVDLISFTGSCGVGRQIQATAGARLAKVCMELGGKNPLIVCDDANLDRAVTIAGLSAFSNAGQRCASGSRLIVFDSVYDRFKAQLLEYTRDLTLGPADEDDLGPVINLRQLDNMVSAVERARVAGATVLTGGDRMVDDAHRDGFYMTPTLLEGAHSDAEISQAELFGPIACMYRVADFEEAIALANASPFGLTAAIHTANVDRAMIFLSRIKSGVASINGGTYGSEPHMPFGGLRQSGTGWREAGTEALDVYS